VSTQPAVTVHSPMQIPADHPAFAGHFPAFPVLPGAVLLDEALQVMQRAWGIDLTQWQIGSAKFLDAVRPGDALTLEHDAPKNGSIRFTILCEDRTVASGSLRNPARAGGAA
jgi:3-hydroxymyristoyl/3-hydroxydecanoyl-(acyl carrier protein) dehydratase